MVKRDKTKEAFSARLSTACSYAGVTGRGIGSEIVRALKGRGITVSTTAVWKWLNSGGMPDAEKMLALSQWLGVRAEWLEYGVGEMVSGLPETSSGDKPATKEKVLQEILSPRQLALLQLFDSLPENEQSQMVESLEEKKRYYDQLFKELARSRNKKLG
ncbi:hypothetical protein ACUIG5_00020 [Raoultella ornithinolytica]|uniref:hypothetical protein n=1 Tax=Raoultella ornithinolytica TaxID=54291 RepID=UPI00403DA4D6